MKLLAMRRNSQVGAGVETRKKVWFGSELAVPIGEEWQSHGLVIYAAVNLHGIWAQLNTTPAPSAMVPVTCRSTCLPVESQLHQ